MPHFTEGPFKEKRQQQGDILEVGWIANLGLIQLFIRGKWGNPRSVVHFPSLTNDWHSWNEILQLDLACFDEWEIDLIKNPWQVICLPTPILTDFVTHFMDHHINLGQFLRSAPPHGACWGSDFILWTGLNDERELVVAIHCKKPTYFISLQGLIVTTKVVGSLPQWQPVTDVSWMRLWWIGSSPASSTQRLPPHFPA